MTTETNLEKLVDQSKKNLEEVLHSNAYKQAVSCLSQYDANIKELTGKIADFALPRHTHELMKTFSDMQKSIQDITPLSIMLPNVSHLTALSKAFENSRAATLAIAGLTNSDKINSLASFASASRPDWYETAFKNSFSAHVISNAFDHSNRANELFKSLSRVVGESSIAAFSVQSSLAKATEYSVFAEKSISSFPWTDLGSKIGLSQIAKNAIDTSFTKLSTNYADLIKSFEQRPTSFFEIDSSLTTIAPVEYYTSANLLGSISSKEQFALQEEVVNDEIRYENEYSLNLYLPQIDQGLIKMWKGAIQVLSSNNDDKARHFSTSIRELFTHLIHSLAPDENIKELLTDANYYHNGRPTRRARLHYIYRNLTKNQNFHKFTSTDIDATLEFLDLFQKGTHSISGDFAQPQLFALKCKAEATLRFMLEIEFAVNRKK